LQSDVERRRDGGSYTNAIRSTWLSSQLLGERSKSCGQTKKKQTSHSDTELDKDCEFQTMVLVSLSPIAMNRMAAGANQENDGG